MFQDRMFVIFLVFSLLAHTAFLISTPSLNLTSSNNAFQKIEVTYKEISLLPREDEIKIEQISKSRPAFKKIDFLNKAKDAPPQFNDYMVKLKLQREFIRKPIVYDQEPVIAGVKKISLPEIKGSLPKNPIYLKYYRAIREKIRRYAYYNYNRAYSGEIYLSFVVAADGGLKALKIIEDKSTPSDYLKEIALKSIKDASPYPNIPEELNHTELSFNVIIAFELD